MSELNYFAAGVLFGGFIVSWAIAEYRKGKKPPQIEFRVDASAVEKLTLVMVNAWLDQRGLVWMPKGAEYMVKKEKP